MCTQADYIEGQEDCKAGNEPKLHKSEAYYQGYEYEESLEEQESEPASNN